MSFFDPLVSRLQRRAPPPPETRQRHMPRAVPDALTRPAWLSRSRLRIEDNPVAFRCARMIAEAAAAVAVKPTPELREPNRPAGDHRRPDPAALDGVLDLLKRPNDGQSGVAFLDCLYMSLLVSGEAFVERVEETETGPRALYLLSPQNMQIVADAHGWPLYFDHHAAGKKTRHDATHRPCPIIHLRLSDMAGGGKGASPWQAAQPAVAIHNSANQWNRALFDNAARPSGALVYRGQDGHARLTDAQFERLKQELQENFQGAENAGRPLLLEGGLDWARISMSPQDMDFIAAKHSAARDIALAFGVPPMLLGIPGDNSYANYAEANRAFWRQTVLPMVTRLLQALAAALLPGRAGLQPDLENITALADERRALWQRIDKAGFLSVDEKRALVGLPPLTASPVAKTEAETSS